MMTDYMLEEARLTANIAATEMKGCECFCQSISSSRSHLKEIIDYHKCQVHGHICELLQAGRKLLTQVQCLVPGILSVLPARGQL